MAEGLSTAPALHGPVKLQKGEAVVLVDGRGKRYLVTLTGKSEAVPRLGVIGTGQLEGAEEGSVLRVGAVQLTVLRPTATDLVASIARRAQIILPKDAAMIALHADVKAGDLVVEGGAGSGQAPGVRRCRRTAGDAPDEPSASGGPLCVDHSEVYNTLSLTHH